MERFGAKRRVVISQNELRFTNIHYLLDEFDKVCSFLVTGGSCSDKSGETIDGKVKILLPGIVSFESANSLKGYDIKWILRLH